MNDEKTFTLTLTAKQVEVIAAALGELPLKLTLTTFSEVQRQVAAQSAPQVDAT